MRSSNICLNMALVATLALATSPVHGQEAEENPVIARANELKAQYEASKAKSDAEAAAVKAKFGPLADYTTEGTVEAGENAGKLEATLLAAEATRQSAGHIVAALCNSNKVGGAATLCAANSTADLILMAEADQLTFDSYDAFRLQLLSVRDEMTSAMGSTCPTSTPAFTESSLAGLSTVVSIAGNLLRSDYKLSHIEVTPSDSLLLKAFVQQARGKVHGNLWAPAIAPQRIDLVNNPALKELAADLKLRNEVKECADKLAKKPKGKKPDPQLAKMVKAIERFDAFYTSLGTADDKGTVPLAVIARQAALSEVMAKPTTYVLTLKADMAGGSAYTKKNFATFLGTMPFSVSGGSLVSYTLVKGREGAMVYADLLPQTEPFMKLHAATARFQNGAGEN